MADMGLAVALEKALRRLDDEWAKCAKENTALREQLREQQDVIDAMSEQLRVAEETTERCTDLRLQLAKQLRRLTDALREAAHDATRREAGAG